MDNLDKVKERIAKLLAMADDAASPNEAAIAAERARRMMDKYQLDEFDIVKDKMEFGASFGTEASARHAAYTGTLAIAIAQYNDVNAKWHYDAGTRNKRIMFLGYLQDVELAEQMMEHLMTTIDNLCKRYMKEHFGRFVSGAGPEYKVSAASAISKRLAAMCAEREAQLVTSSGTALVVVKKAAVEEHFGAPKYRTKTRALSNDEMARHARTHGWQDGQKVEIVKSVK